ncbi:50S ribosomal protein L25/general stress protein Ctc [Gardnerella vaginalis]|uniref:50S ribosomal protein L25/general stress protein Ctc n=1 Tax=Gardnerella vaginalis TaxID=2702 RepID=UPI0039F01747
MATKITLEGEVRNEFGKGVARRLRVANLIPASIYAGGAEPVHVTLPMRETTLSLRHANALFTIKFGNESRIAVVKDVQRNPVKRIVEHIDFYEVKAGEKIDVEVPVFVEGTPKGAAVAFVDVQELKVRADVANLPERLVVNVDGLTDGTKVFAKDVKLPEGVVLDMDGEESVVSVTVPEDAATEEPAAATAADAAADAAAPAAEAPAAE